ncbi:uncharacterized protein LOC116303514 [Actinia tenebrosa]|uniref:Uncharacterized protein LOC116303514 n=1 Tax=Actinia tenebrosa TaxID=6105 RepID=A0A6P8IPW8_ACTTE|nr:uncharacterized protein LOC116303514 [Actinia tenebrosa]
MIEVINSKLGKISLTALAAVGAGVITIKLYYPKYDLFKIHRIPFFKKENLLIKENEDNVNIKALADLEWSSCGQSQYPGSIYRTHFSSIPCLLWIFPGGLPLGLLIVTPIKWLQSFKTKSLKNGTTEIQEERTKPDEKVNDSRTDEESLVQEKSVSQQEVEDNTVKESFLQQTSVSQKEVEDITVEESFIQQTPLSHQVVEDIAVEESFLQQTPLSHQVVEKVTVEESFLQQLPVLKQVVEEVTVEESFLHQTSVSQQVVEEVTAEESFIQQTPLSHQVVEDITVEESFLQQTSVSQHVDEDFTVEESCLQQLPVSQQVVEEVTVEESFLHQTSVSQHVDEDFTVDESCLQQLPVSQQVVEDITVEESCVQETSVSQQVVEDITVDESFLQETPKKQPVVEDVVKESLLQEIEEGRTLSEHLDVSPTEKLLLQKSPKLEQLVEDFPSEKLFQEGRTQSEQVVEDCPNEELLLQKCPKTEQVLEDCFAEESFLKEKIQTEQRVEELIAGKSSLQERTETEEVVADSAARKLTSHPKVEVEKLDKSLPSAEKSSVGTKSKNKHKQRLKKLERCCSKCPSRNIHADNGEKDKYISSNSPNIPCSETNNRKSSTNTEKVVEASVSDYFTQHAKSSVVRNEPCIVKYDNQDRSSGNGKNRSKKKKGKTLFSNSIAYGQRNRDAQPNVSENRVQPLDKGTLNTPKISSSSNKVSSPFETHPKKDAEKDRGSKAYADRKMDHTTSACAKAPPNAEIKGGLEKESAFKLDDRPSCKNVKSRKESTGFYREVIDNNSTRNVPGKNENRDASHSGNNKHKKKKSYSKVLFSNSIGYGQGSNTNGATTDSKLQVPDSFPPICRQHSKQSSTLTSKSPSAHAFPKWGGSIGSVFFTNTCSIDNWIVIFHHLCMENQAIKKRIQRPDGKFLKQLEDLYNSGQFDKLKYQLMKVNKIPDFRGRVDFFGNEWNNYIRHMDLFFKNTQLSTCCSRYCPAKERYLTNSNCITWANCDISLSEEVQVWFQPEKEVSYCGQKFTSRPPQEAPIVVQSNSALCCDGRRRTHARSFKDGLPLIIPVDVELMSQIKTDLNWKDLPETIDVLNTRYQLNAATLLNETARHYTCIFRYHNEWFYYDGMVNGGNPTVFTQFPVQYRLSTCIYVRK